MQEIRLAVGPLPHTTSGYMLPTEQSGHFPDRNLARCGSLVREGARMSQTDRKTSESSLSWKTLDELHDVARRAGCPEESFSRILAEVGSDPSHVAKRLQSEVMTWTPRSRYS
jgi:hypothetical protein